MRNKRHVQLTLGQIEAVQQSFIQFIRNTSLADGGRVFLEKQIEVNKDMILENRQQIAVLTEMLKNRTAK